jgi:hypothetical protein
MNNVAHMNPSGMINMNSNVMLDNFKSMMLTMAMVKGTNQTDNTSFLNTLIIMLLVSFIDTIVIQVKKIVHSLTTQLDMYIANKTTNISIIENITSMTTNKSKKSSIMVTLESSNPTSNAVIDTITHLPHTKCILFKNGNYMVNYNEEIELSKGLYAQMSSGTANMNEQETKQEQKTTTSENIDSLYGYVELFSYTMDMEMLRNEMDKIVSDYLIKMTNKLGDNLYCFSVFPVPEYKDAQGKIDHTRSPEHLHFTMKPFKTNRSFKNLFGKNIDLIRKRVEFFRDNETWYNEKGIPYNLGISLSGETGSGKTSSIKVLAKELIRHPFIVHFKDYMTTTQLENLFFNEQVHVLHNGKTHTFTIPINKRIYIFEDLDCQCEVILDRGSETAEQMLAKKNAELKEEIEKLRHALSEMSSGKRVVMTGGNMPKLEEKRDKDDKKITLSFMLNLFDGISEQPGRVYVLTTNFLNKLDKAFIRPGRFDVKCEFGLSDADQIIQIIEHRYDAKLTQEQLDKIRSLPECISPAELGKILFENFDDLNGSLVSLEAYANDFLIKDKLKKEEEEATKNKVLALELKASEEKEQHLLVQRQASDQRQVLDPRQVLEQTDQLYYNPLHHQQMQRDLFDQPGLDDFEYIQQHQSSILQQFSHPPIMSDRGIKTSSNIDSLSEFNYQKYDNNLLTKIVPN